MHRTFCPFRGLIVFLFLFGLSLVSFAADKKRKAAPQEAKAKPAKPDAKQQAKTGREARKEKERNSPQLARKKSEEEKSKRGKLVDKLARDKGKEKNARHEADKKNDKTKDKLAQREADKKRSKKELAAKKVVPEKDAKDAKDARNAKDSKATKPSTKAEIAEAKVNSKAIKPDPKQPESKDTAKRAATKLLAKADSKAKPESKPELRQEVKPAIKELPASKFTLRPIAKVMPKVELKFTVARALSTTVFDAPPPRDLGPDVIDVIEHDSPEAKRLDDLLRSEVKTLHFSSIPNVSHKKLDIGKMDTERIKQIQEVLAQKGYYAGEITGQYDDPTIEAMRKFQAANKIDVTGYATAQSLRLLGLTDW